MASAELLLTKLKSHGVTDVVGLPDNSSAALLTLLRDDREVVLHSVTREGEAHALAAGLWIGGRQPLILIQNTGLLESGDSLRALIRTRLPIVCLITYRGYAKMAKLGTAVPDFPDAVILSRADLDSVALMTEPTLKAWGLPFDFLHTDEDMPRLSAAFENAQKTSSPVAVLVTQDLS